MTWVPDKSGSNPGVDLPYNKVNRSFATEVPGTVVPLYVGERVTGLNGTEAALFKAVGTTSDDWVPLAVEH